MRILSSISPWLLVLALVVLVVNISPCNVKPITPAVLIYALQNSPLPILFSPFLVQSWTAGIARVLQLAWIATQPPSARLTLVYFVQLYPAVLAARAGTGFIFGRAVGWKYPHLFSHDAVYEPIAGFGPILLGSLLFDDILGHDKLLGHDKRPTLFRAVLGLVFVVLDGMPWGYMCGAAIVGIYRLSYAILCDGGYTALPRHIHIPNTERQRTPEHNHPPLTKKRIFLTSILAIPVLGLTGSIPALIQDLTRAPPQPRKVHIVMLTVPRTRDLSSDVMIDSIQSYLDPWKPSQNVSLSSSLTVLAHLGPDGTHPAFDRARAFFHTSFSTSPFSSSTSNTLPLTFYVEPPPPTGNPIMNHYAHLADAVRYARTAREKAEWTMFVEDDFMLCGEWGWEGLMRVLERLDEEGGEEGEEGKGTRMNGAFVGTGGSGIIFHHTILPTLEQTLSILSSLSPSSSSSSSSSTQKLIPPDVLLQNCLTSSLPPGLCPSNSRGYVISSRMLMGHMGGKLSTGGRVYEEGKWACGWRSAMHGNVGAEVVVV